MLVNFLVFFLLLISWFISLWLEKMFTHYFLYFPLSAGISVGLGWNHHHLPLSSYWILCPEVWKGNLSLSTVVVTVPLLLYGQVTKITFTLPLSYPLGFSLFILNFTRWLVSSGLHGQAVMIELETRPRMSAKTEVIWECYFI